MVLTRLVLPVFLAAFAAVVPDRAVGQTESQTTAQNDAAALPQTAAATTAPPAPEVTAEWVQERIKETEQNSGLDEELRAGLLKSYNAALAFLRAAEDWATKAAEYEKQRLAASETLQQIKAALAAPASETKPEVAGDESVQQLEQLLAQREAEFKAAQTKVTELEEERRRRADRKQRAPQEIAAARQELEEANKTLNAATPPEEAPQLTEARRKLQLARKRALERQIGALDQEILSYDARGALLTARLDQAARQAAQLEAVVKVWRELVNDRRRAEAERAAREAKTARRQAAQKHGVVRKLADENAALAERRTKEDLAAKIEAARQRLQVVNAVMSEKAAEFDDLANKLEAVGLTKAMALLLRNKLEGLPDVHGFERTFPKREAEMSSVQVTLLNAQDDRKALTFLEPLIREIMAGVEPPVSDADRAENEAAARELLATRRKLLDSLIDDYETYFDTLASLDNAEKTLREKIGAYESFITERILWVPSSSPPRPSDLGLLARGGQWLLDPEQWVEAGRVLVVAGRTHPIQSTMSLAVLVLLLGAQPRLRRNLRVLGETASKGSATRLAPTMGALVVTGMLALPWPAMMAVPGWLLGTAMDASSFAGAVGAGLRTAAMLLLGLEALRWVCRPGGLGDAHLGWSEASLRSIRLHLFGLVAFGLPCAFVVSAVEWERQEDDLAALGRLAFIAGHIVVAVFAHRVMRPKSPVMQAIAARHATGWVWRTRYVGYLFAVGLPSALAGLGLAGYYYTAVHLAKRLQATAVVVLVLMLLNGVLLRWALLARRRLAIEQLRKRRAAAQAEDKSAVPGVASEPVPEAPQEPAVDLTIVGIQIRDLIRSVIAVSLVVGMWLVWADVLPALGRLNVVLWQTEVQPNVITPVRVAHVVWAGLALLITFLGTKNLPGLLEITLLQRLPLQTDSRYAISTLSRYGLAIVGIVVAASMVEVTWDKVQWLAAAATVGLGFGLQEIFANFVSGIIILFERPIRVGDIVTTNGRDGRVTRIRMRATTILDWDNRELIVPNKEFITGSVVNWTLSEPVTRVVIPIGIAYGSDTEKARQIMLEVADACEYVMKDPPPRALFREFGDSSLNFWLFIYLATRNVWVEAMHYMHTNIDLEFRKAGIEIAFPQRDLHIRSIQAPLSIRGREVKDLTFPSGSSSIPQPSGVGE